MKDILRAINLKVIFYNMKKIFRNIVALVALLVAGFNAYLLFFKGGSSSTVTASNLDSVQANETTSSSEASSVASSSSQGSETTVQQESQTSTMTDGTYTGAVTSTRRGDYQVQITVSGGAITDISLLEYPNDDRRSQAINNSALPVYISEALSNQSSDVSLVSGASEAYNGFTGSLQDAINQANS